MNRKIMILFLIIFITISGCYSKEKLKEILENGLTAKYKGEDESSLTYTIMIDEVDGKKMIDFFSDSLSDQYEGGAPLLYDKAVIDENKKTISYYKADDGLLIITIEFLNNYKEIRIIDYGKWLNYEEKYKPLNATEDNVSSRFHGFEFYDKSRVYKLLYL